MCDNECVKLKVNKNHVRIIINIYYSLCKWSLYVVTVSDHTDVVIYTVEILGCLNDLDSFSRTAFGSPSSKRTFESKSLFRYYSIRYDYNWPHSDITCYQYEEFNKIGFNN